MKSHELFVQNYFSVPGNDVRQSILQKVSRLFSQNSLTKPVYLVPRQAAKSSEPLLTTQYKQYSMPKVIEENQ